MFRQETNWLRNLCLIEGVRIRVLDGVLRAPEDNDGRVQRNTQRQICNFQSSLTIASTIYPEVRDNLVM